MDTLRLCLFVLELLLNVGVCFIQSFPGSTPLKLFCSINSLQVQVIFLSALLAILLSRTNTLDRNPKVLLANHQLASFLIALTR
jgi:hypothetical protein